MIKFIFAIAFSVFSSLAFADSSTCPSIAGDYLLPSKGGTTQELSIVQDGCSDIAFTVCGDGFCPIGAPEDLDGKFDGCVSMTVVGNTIVQRSTGSCFTMPFQTSHGACSSNNVTYSLDANGNLIRTANNMTCPDRFSGPYTEVDTRENN
jgi:hypothetical protein